MLGQRFVERMGSLTTATLSCFDRVILTGYWPFFGKQYVNSWVDQELKIRRKDFLPLMKPLSDQLVANAKALAEEAGAAFVFVPGKRKKEDLVNRLAVERKHPDGLIAVLQVQETGQTLKLCHAEGRPVWQFTRRPMRVLYFYFNDPDFGRMFVRIQTATGGLFWFPFITQVYVNGHEWLARQMWKKQLGFTQRDSAFTQLDDSDAAQKLADILLGSRDQSIRFDELCRVVRALGFDARVRGSHHIFTKENIDEIINLQPKRDLAKPYQVRQVRQLIHKYRLELP